MNLSVFVAFVFDDVCCKLFPGLFRYRARNHSDLMSTLCYLTLVVFIFAHANMEKAWSSGRDCV